MSASNISIGIALGAMFGALIIVWQRRYRDLFAVLFVAGIAALAVAVTIVQVEQYRAQKAVNDAAVQSEKVTASGMVAGPPPQPPVALPSRPPMVRGPTGSAAPPAVENPYAGGSR